jgi:hypothetical protein
MKLGEPVLPGKVCLRGRERRQFVGHWFLGTRHVATVVFKIGADDSGEFTFKTFFCHNGNPLLKVSNRRSQCVDNSKERVNQMRD